GRNQPPVGDTVRTVLGIRGEPGRPSKASEGLVWRAIIENLQALEYEDDWVSITRFPRQMLTQHPWVLTGGGAHQLTSLLETSTDTLESHVSSIGYTGQTNADDAFLADAHALNRRGFTTDHYRDFLIGQNIRDYSISGYQSSLFPYDRNGGLVQIADSVAHQKYMWPLRAILENRATFAGGTYRTEGRPWWEWHQVATSRLSGKAITWSFIQTHNHFTFLRNAVCVSRWLDSRRWKDLGHEVIIEAEVQCPVQGRGGAVGAAVTEADRRGCR